MHISFVMHKTVIKEYGIVPKAYILVYNMNFVNYNMNFVNWQVCDMGSRMPQSLQTWVEIRSFMSR